MFFNRVYQFFEILAFSRFLVLPRSRLFARSVILAKIRDLGVTKKLEKVRISKN